MESQQEQQDSVFSDHFSQEERDSVWWNHLWFQCFQVGLSSVSALLSAIMFVGLLLPLLIQLKQGSHQTPARSRGRGEPNYSTFNLYLVYVAFGDLVLSLYDIHSAVRWKYIPLDLLYNPSFLLLPGNPSLWEWMLFGCIHGVYHLSSIFLNAIMCHQIKVLLEASHRAQRLNQPSLTRVNLQGATAYLLPGIFFLIGFAPSSYLIAQLQLWGYVVSWSVSFLYILYVTFLVWCRGYIPPVSGASASARAARELAFYFYRICGTYLFFFIPSMVLLTLTMVTGQMWCAPIAGLCTSIQPIVLFWVILQKSDAKKYIVELVTLSYVFSNCNCHCSCVSGKDEAVERDTTTRISTSILGFDITVDDEDSDAPNGDDRAITGMDVETAEDDAVGEA